MARAEKKNRQGKELSPREKLFCYYMAYLNNPEEAAAKAGYKASSATVDAIRLLDNGRIRRLIQTWRRREREETGILAALGLKRLIFSHNKDVLRLLGSNGDMSEEELAKLDTFMVSEVKKQKGGGIEIKFFDKIKAAEVMANLVNAADNPAAEQPEETGKSLLEALEKSAAAVSVSAGEERQVMESPAGEV